MSRVARLAAAKGGERRAVLELAGTAHRAHGRRISMRLDVVGAGHGLRPGIGAQTDDRTQHSAIAPHNSAASPNARCANFKCANFECANRPDGASPKRGVAGVRRPRTPTVIILPRRPWPRNAAPRLRNRCVAAIPFPRTASGGARMMTYVTFASRSQQPAFQSERHAALFPHDGINIAFFDEGKGDPVVLVRGFSSTAQVELGLSPAGRRR